MPHKINNGFKVQRESLCHVLQQLDFEDDVEVFKSFPKWPFLFACYLLTNNGLSCIDPQKLNNFIQFTYDM